MNGSSYYDCAKIGYYSSPIEKIKKGLIGLCDDWNEIGFNSTERVEKQDIQPKELKKNDNLIYLKSDNGDFKGVGVSEASVRFSKDVDGFITVTEGQVIREDFNEMCIAWLCLFDPDVIASDKGLSKNKQITEDNNRLKEKVIIEKQAKLIYKARVEQLEKVRDSRVNNFLNWIAEGANFVWVVAVCLIVPVVFYSIFN